MVPKAKLPPRPFQQSSLFRRFSGISRFSGEERHILSELSNAWDAAAATAAQKRAAELKPKVPTVLQDYPRYTADAFAFINKFTHSANSRDYGASLLEYMAGKYPQAHAQVCDIARNRLGFGPRHDAKNPQSQDSKPPIAQDEQSDQRVEWYSRPETFLPVVSRAPPVHAHANDAAGQTEKPWYAVPVPGVTIKKKEKSAPVPKEKSVVLPPPVGYSRYYPSNPLVDNLRFYFGVINPAGLRFKSISKFIRSDPVSSRAVQIVNENGLDLANPEHVRQLEKTIGREFSQDALGPMKKKPLNKIKRKFMTIDDLKTEPPKPTNFNVEYTPFFHVLVRNKAGSKDVGVPVKATGQKGGWGRVAGTKFAPKLSKDPRENVRKLLDGTLPFGSKGEFRRLIKSDPEHIIAWHELTGTKPVLPSAAKDVPPRAKRQKDANPNQADTIEPLSPAAGIDRVVGDLVRYRNKEPSPTEINEVNRLLADLVQGVEEPAYKFGRPALPLKEQVFCAIQKVYSQRSSRGAVSLFNNAVQNGLITHRPYFNAVSKFLNREDVTPILQHLVAVSAPPLKAVETGFAMGSTDFRVPRLTPRLKSKNRTAQINELLCKVIAHNLTVVQENKS